MFHLLLLWWPAYHIKGCDGMIRLLRLSKVSFREQQNKCVSIMHAFSLTCSKTNLKNDSSWWKYVPLTAHMFSPCSQSCSSYCLRVSITETGCQTFFQTRKGFKAALHTALTTEKQVPLQLFLIANMHQSKPKSHCQNS